VSRFPEVRERTLRYALQHLANRRGQADRAELRRIYQPSDGDTVVDGLVAKGFVEEREHLDERLYLVVTEAGHRALADREWP
jgi:DNA-binding MarR family transcriptional regulator